MGALVVPGDVERMKGAGWPSFAVVQAESKPSAAAARQAIRSFFINYFIGDWPQQITPAVGATLRGLTLPCFSFGEAAPAQNQSGSGHVSATRARGAMPDRRIMAQFSTAWGWPSAEREERKMNLGD